MRLVTRPSPTDTETDILRRGELVRHILNTHGASAIRPSIIEAIRTLPRHEFVRPEDRDFAYDDTPLPIGFGQTISQPSLVAWMTEALQPEPGARILEIGTGSGYQAAVLAAAGASVYTMEIVEPLARRAAEVFRKLGLESIHTRIGDGYGGWPEASPFHGVIVTCAPGRIPDPLVDQTAEGGRIVIPVGPLGEQVLHVLIRHGRRLIEESSMPVRFVPMTGKAAAW